MAKIFFLENFTHNSWLVNYLFCVCKVIYIFSFSQTFNKLFLPSHYHIYTSKMPKFIISNRLPKEKYLNNFSPPPKRPFHHHPEDLSITPLKTFPSPPGGLSIVSIPSCATTSHHPHSPLRARTFIIYTTLIECLAVYPRVPPPCPPLPFAPLFPISCPRSLIECLAVYPRVPPLPLQAIQKKEPAHYWQVLHSLYS